MGGAGSTQVRSESRGLVRGHSLTGFGAWPRASGHSGEKPLVEQKGGRTGTGEKAPPGPGQMLVVAWRNATSLERTEMSTFPSID